MVQKVTSALMDALAEFAFSAGCMGVSSTATLDVICGALGSDPNPSFNDLFQRGLKLRVMVIKYGNDTVLDILNVSTLVDERVKNALQRKLCVDAA